MGQGYIERKSLRKLHKKAVLEQFNDCLNHYTRSRKTLKISAEVYVKFLQGDTNIRQISLPSSIEIPIYRELFPLVFTDFKTLERQFIALMVMELEQFNLTNNQLTNYAGAWEPIRVVQAFINQVTRTYWFELNIQHLNDGIESSLANTLTEFNMTPEMKNKQDNAVNEIRVLFSFDKC